MTSNFQSLQPVVDLTSNDLRCYQMSPGGGGSTSTSKVTAGSTITWSSNKPIFHPGPMSAYMAQVPAGQTAATWDGSGAVWFKVFQDYPTFSESGVTWPSQSALSLSLCIPLLSSADKARPGLRQSKF